jgi:hypothetical protein
LSCLKSTADPLLGFCLSRAFSFHASDPRPAQTRGSEHVPSPEGSGTRLKGPLDPSRRVRPSQHLVLGRSRRQLPAPFETGLHRLSTVLLLPWPWSSGQALHP